MPVDSINSNRNLLANSKITASFGTFNSDMSPRNTIIITEDITDMIKNSVLTIPKNHNFNKTYAVEGNNKYVQVICNERVYNIADGKYSKDIVIDLSLAKRNIAIVYNVFIAPLANWQGIVAGQLLQLRSYGILSEADLYIHVTDCYGLVDDAIKLMKSIVPDVIISTSTKNEYEYHGIKLIHDLAKLDPDRIYIYFHSKGMSHGLYSRSLVDITLLTTTFLNWRKEIQFLGNNGVEKVGVFPAFGDVNPFGILGQKGGWIWYNFWYATGKYLAKCPEPRLTSDRYYYEEWLGLQNADDTPILRQDCKSIYSIKMIAKTFYSSLEAEYYMDRLIYKYNYSKILKDLPYIIKSSFVFYLYLKVKSFPRYDLAVRGQFAKLFKDFNKYLEAAKVQGFQWNKSIYEFKDRKPKLIIEMLVDETNYNSLLARYKEMFTTSAGGGSLPDVPFEIESYIVEIDTGKIDADYMNSRFVKYMKSLHQTDITEDQRKIILDELHKSFSTLTQEEQKFANIFLNDVMSGNVKLTADKTLRDYITEYLYRAKYGQILKISSLLGLDKDKLQNLMQSNVTELNINEYGRFDELKATVDRDKAKAYFEKLEGKTLPNFRISIKIDQLLKDFISKDGFELVE